jgi:hypothetical protein
MANKKVLATFRIEEEEWEAFKEWSNANGSNASAVLIDLVRGCLSGKTPGVSSVPSPDSTPTHLDDSTEQRIDKIEQRLDKEIDKRDDYLDKRIDSIDRCIEEMRSQLEELRGKLKAR